MFPKPLSYITTHALSANPHETIHNNLSLTLVLLSSPGFERNVPGYPRYQYSGEAALGEHHLIIKGITLEDDGEYQCQVGPTANALPIWAAANVTVMGKEIRETRGVRNEDKARQV